MVRLGQYYFWRAVVEYLQKQTSFVILMHMNKKWILIAAIFWLFVGACNVDSGDVNNYISSPKSRGLILQPYEGIDEKITEEVYQQLTKTFSSVERRKPIPLPSRAFYIARNRFRADSIIKFQKSEVPNNYTMIGITHKDISTRKAEHEDWGIMGLAYRPGNSCIASYYRLPAKDKNSAFFKVVIHELGHTEGLAHCKRQSCYMQDAEGKNKTAQLTQFCSACKKILLGKGWNL